MVDEWSGDGGLRTCVLHEDEDEGRGRGARAYQEQEQ
jgi:hypothetical protein